MASSAAGEFFRVDLSALQAAGVVHVDRLPIREFVQGRWPGLAGVRRPGLLDPAEGELDLGADRRRVHVGDARLQFLHGPERPPEVRRVDLGGGPVIEKKRERDRVVEIFRLEDAQDRTEYILRRQALSAIDLKDRGLAEEPFV